MAKRPDGLPPAEHHPHGTRSRYVTGCRCSPCKKANLDAYYERRDRAKEAAASLGKRTGTHCIGANEEPCPRGMKLGNRSTGNFCARCRDKLVWNGLIPADKARRHILALSKNGVGYRAVHDKSGVAASVVADIRTGKKKRIRAQTEKKILAVELSDLADGVSVDAAPTWEKIRILIEEHDYTKAAISKLIGQDGRALQLSKGKLTVASVKQIDALFEHAEDIPLRDS